MLMNAIELINKIKEIALSQNTVNSVYDGDVYNNWNTNEVKYGSVNIGLESVEYANQISYYNLILYYGDRLLQSDFNANNLYVDGINTLQSILNILNTLDFIDVSDVTYYTFNQKFCDYLGGVYCRVRIMTDSPIGDCSLDDFIYIDDRDKLIKDLLDQLNKWKSKDEELSRILQEVLHKLNCEEI